jgi:hypothetical protein
MPLQPLQITGPEIVRFSYHQVVVFDDSESVPGSLWNDEHWNQGFARREKTVSFSTLEQAGKATLKVLLGWPDDLQTAERVVAVPLQVPSGTLHIEGPEEYPTSRAVSVEPGIYMVALAQRTDETGRLTFELFLDKRTENRSRILKADGALNPAEPLLETAEPA